MARLAKEIRRVRQARRKAKDFVHAAEPLVEWVEKNKPVIKEPERVLGDVRKAEKSLENRIYFPRTGNNGDDINYFTFNKVLDKTS